MTSSALRTVVAVAAMLVASTSVMAQTASLGSYDRRAEWVWQPVAIGAGGFIRGMVVHPLGGGTVRYARTDTYGAYRWDNTAQRWVNMITAAAFPATITIAGSKDPSSPSSLLAAPLEAGVDSIAVDPRNASRMYIAMTVSPPPDITRLDTRRGYVYYSSNGGRSFAQSTGLGLPSYTNPACSALEFDTLNTAGERLKVDPANSSILYLGTRLNGVYMSSNSGVAFAPVAAAGVPGACQTVQNVLFDSSATIVRRINGRSVTVSRTLYLVVDASTGSGVYRSIDGGQSFTNIADGQPGVGSGQLTGSALGPDGSFWLMTNSTLLRWRGGSWTVQNPPYTSGSVVVDPANPNRLFVTSYDMKIARSNDGGQTWTDLGNYASIKSADGIAWIDARVVHPGAHGALQFDPSVSTANGGGRLWLPQGNDGTIYADLNDAVQTGYTQGLNWKAQSKGIEQLVGQNALIPPGGRNAAVLTAEDEALYYVSNPRLFTARRYDIDTAAQGNNDLATNGMAAFIPDTPSVLVTVPANLFAGGWRGGAFRNNFAGYSVNYGQNWQLFPSIKITSGDNSYGGGSITNTPERLVGGMIAISARGSVLPGRGQGIWTGRDNIVWFPFGAQWGYFGANNVPPHYSLDGGSSWQESVVLDEDGTPIDFSKGAFQLIFTSASKQFSLVADPVVPRKFYGLPNGRFMTSDDGGATFRIPRGTGDYFRYRDFFINAKLVAVPGRSGDLWLCTGHGDQSTAGMLYHSTNGGQSWERLSLGKAYAVAVGKPAAGREYALYIYGQPDSAKPWGVYRSDDKGVSWSLISGSGSTGYPFGTMNVPSDLAASQDVEGLLYISFTGMSYGYGYMKARGNPYPAQ
ncbi:MAG: hypothetical protein WCO11_12515 [Sphingomonadales bacterium]|jgi:hypothetical protein